MKKLIFLAAIAAFMLHGCADEPIAAPVDENSVETRAIVGSDITVSPAGLTIGQYLLTGVEYTFTSPYSIYAGPSNTSSFYVLWKIGDEWESQDFYAPPYYWDGKLVHTFDTPGTYTVRSGRFSKQQMIGRPPLDEHVSTFTVVDSFMDVSYYPVNSFPLMLGAGDEYKFTVIGVVPANMVTRWVVRDSNGTSIRPIMDYGNYIGVVLPANGVYTVTAEYGSNIENSMTVNVGRISWPY